MGPGFPAVLETQIYGSFFGPIECGEGILIDREREVVVRFRVATKGPDHLLNPVRRIISLPPPRFDSEAIAGRGPPLDGLLILCFAAARTRREKVQRKNASVTDDHRPLLPRGSADIGQVHVVGLELLAWFLEAQEGLFEFGLDHGIGSGDGSQRIGKLGSLVLQLLRSRGV